MRSQDHDLGLSHDLPADRRARPGPPWTARPVRRGGRCGRRRLRPDERQRPSTSRRPRTRAAAAPPTAGGRRLERLGGRGRDPRGDRRPLPRRRLQRGRTCSARAASCARHHQQLRVRLRHRRGRAADDPAEGLRPRRRRRRPSCTGAAVYLWHCDREGSTRCTPKASRTRTTCAASRRPTTRAAWSSPASSPAAYAGRWPHVHFEVYPSPGRRDERANKLRTSQLALPEDVCEQVYEADGYERASATSRRPRWTPTTSSATATRCRWPR